MSFNNDENNGRISNKNLIKSKQFESNNQIYNDIKISKKLSKYSKNSKDNTKENERSLYLKNATI